MFNSTVDLYFMRTNPGLASRRRAGCSKNFSPSSATLFHLPPFAVIHEVLTRIVKSNVLARRYKRDTYPGAKGHEEEGRKEEGKVDENAENEKKKGERRERYDRNG